MKKSRTYSIEDSIYETFDKTATKMNINKSSFIEEKIIEFVEKNESLLKDKFEEDWLILISTMGITDPIHAEKLIKYAKKSVEMSNMRFMYQPLFINHTPMELSILSKLDPSKFYVVETPIARSVGDIQFTFSEDVETISNDDTQLKNIIVDKMVIILNNTVGKIGVYSLLNDVKSEIDYMGGKDNKHKISVKIISRLILKS